MKWNCSNQKAMLVPLLVPLFVVEYSSQTMFRRLILCRHCFAWWILFFFLRLLYCRSTWVEVRPSDAIACWMAASSSNVGRKAFVSLGKIPKRENSFQSSCFWGSVICLLRNRVPCSLSWLGLWCWPGSSPQASLISASPVFSPKKSFISSKTFVHEILGKE